MRSLYITLLDFFEQGFEHRELPASIHPDNVEVHRQLLDAIAKGEGAALDAAVRRHDRHRQAMGLFKEARRHSRRSGAATARLGPAGSRIEAGVGKGKRPRGRAS